MRSGRVTGSYEATTVAGEEVAAFVPHTLPPSAPELELDESLLEQAHAAEEALRRLELAGAMVPSLDWFIYGFVRKEAVVSSQIEGTQATLVDLLSFEAEGAGDAPENADLREVCNYLEALDSARDQIARPDGLPLSVRLLNETHARLMQGVRGADKMPGEIRRSSELDRWNAAGQRRLRAAPAASDRRLVGRAREVHALRRWSASLGAGGFAPRAVRDDSSLP